jgi:hypothetical protein
MALAAYSNRRKPTAEEERLTIFLLQGTSHLEPKACEALRESQYYSIGHDDKEFRNFGGIFHDKIFDIFYQYAKTNMKKPLPLLISGGYGLNCDWNTRWWILETIVQDRLNEGLAEEDLFSIFNAVHGPNGPMTDELPIELALLPLQDVHLFPHLPGSTGPELTRATPCQCACTVENGSLLHFSTSL